jgi:putative hydrolase of the HAD superfamily
MQRNKAIFWDFDGTLGYRPGMWSGALQEAIHSVDADSDISLEEIRPLLQIGFPWHTPEIPHPEMGDPDVWWEHVYRSAFAKALDRLGYDAQRARAIAECTRQRFVDPSSWRVFDDVPEVLIGLARAGWGHVIVSNHVPELPLIARHLGLTEIVAAIVNSATCGYEKPRPEIFTVARQAAGQPDVIWMVGDSPKADIAGAASAGIDGILVRTESPDVPLRCASLYEVMRIVDPHI